MSWEDQGRQEHGWFGSGTAPKTDQQAGSSGAGLFGPGGLDQRIHAVIYGAAGALPLRLANTLPHSQAARRLSG